MRFLSLLLLCLSSLIAGAADVYVDDAGTVRRIQRIYVDDAGTVRQLQRAYVDDLGTVRLVFSSGGVAPGNFPQTLSVQDFSGGGTNGGRITFTNTGGTVGQYIGSGSPVIVTPWTDPNWFTPTTIGVGASYWLRLVPTSGAFTANAASSCVSLSTSRAAEILNPPASGVDTVVFTIQVATDATCTNLVINVPGNVLTVSR